MPMARNAPEPPDLTRIEGRLRWAREKAGFTSIRSAANFHHWPENTYKAREQGERGMKPEVVEEYAKAFSVSLEWMVTGKGDPKPKPPPVVPVIGYVGADPSGRVLFTEGQNPNEWADMPAGGSPDTVALFVNGHSMKGDVDHGSLIYFERQASPPTPDMIGQLVIVETEDGEVLVKRLYRGSEPKRYDLESTNAPKRENVRLRWAAHPIAIVPPFHARRILRTAADLRVVNR